MKAKKTKHNLAPLGDRVLVRPFDENRLQLKSDSGIIIPETAKEDAPQQGEVIAVGVGRYEDGKLVAPPVVKGDWVVYSKYGYDEVKIGDLEYVLVKADNILAKITK